MVNNSFFNETMRLVIETPRYYSFHQSQIEKFIQNIDNKTTYSGVFYYNKCTIIFKNNESLITIYNMILFNNAKQKMLYG